MRTLQAMDGAPGESSVKKSSKPDTMMASNSSKKSVSRNQHMLSGQNNLSKSVS